MQVTAKLAGVCVQALELPCNSPSDEIRHTPIMAFTSLNLWLDTAVATMRGSLGSRAAAAVRQQLQDSGLLQHLGPAMDAAAARLTAAVAALAAASSGSSGTSTALPSTTQRDSMQLLVSCVEKADKLCGLLLEACQLTSSVLSQQARFSFEPALAAAPAAMRLILTGFQACSKLQLLWQQNRQLLPPLVCKVAAFGSSFLRRFCCIGLVLPVVVFNDSLQSSPAGRALLLSPDYVSCLAIVLAVTVLGLWLDAGSDDGRAGATAPAARSSSAPGVGSSTGARRRQQQQQAGGSNGSGSSSGNGGRVRCSLRLDSVAPLSCSLFDTLGVTKETVLQAARLAKAERLASVREVESLAMVYGCVLQYQVSWCFRCAFSPAYSITVQCVARREIALQ
jgi:hypothetical protein